MSVPTLSPTPIGVLAELELVRAAMTRSLLPSPRLSTSGSDINRRDDQHGADFRIEVPALSYPDNRARHAAPIDPCFVRTRASFGDTLLNLSGPVTLAGSASERPKKKGITGQDC